MGPPTGRHLGPVLEGHAVNARIKAAGHVARVTNAAKREHLDGLLTDWSAHLAPVVESLWGEILDAEALPPALHDLIARAAGR